jgi:hypothetical protein
MREAMAVKTVQFDTRVIPIHTVILSYMDVRVQGGGPSGPFLSAQDVFETEYDIEKRVCVQIRSDPDERTWTAHYDDHHVLNMSDKVATSAMARELALHEYSHMHRNEQDHPSHTQSTTEALYLALTGRTVDQRTLSHCYQIANHMKDIYADDITMNITHPTKLVSFLESSLASAVVDRPTDTPGTGQRLTATADPEITAVNAAFALALCERHDLVGDDHPLYDLAHAAAKDAPNIKVNTFKNRFRTLTTDPNETEYRKALVGITRKYAANTNIAAD